MQCNYFCCATETDFGHSFLISQPNFLRFHAVFGNILRKLGLRLTFWDSYPPPHSKESWIRHYSSEEFHFSNSWCSGKSYMVIHGVVPSHSYIFVYGYNPTYSQKLFKIKIISFKDFWFSLQEAQQLFLWFMWMAAKTANNMFKLKTDPYCSVFVVG